MSRMNGWVKLHRQSLDHWLYNESRPHTRREAWEDMLLLANHEDNKVMIQGELIECKSGQSVMSLKNWAKQFKWSIQQVRTFFSLLNQDRMITIEGLRKTTRITICNYALYQKDPQADNTQTTHKQHTGNKQTTTNKKDKNEENEKNDKNEKKLSFGDKSPDFKNCVDVFFEVYQKEFNLKPVFTSTDGKILKELISKLQPNVKNGTLPDAFRVLLEKLPKFYKEKMNLKTINSNYNGIIAEIRSKSGSNQAEAWQRTIDQYNSK